MTDRTAGARSLSFLLARVGFESARRLRDRLEPLGIEPRHLAVLNQVVLSEGQSQQALADALGIPKSGMAGLIDELERRGFVERRRSDRRTHAIHLTRAGVALLRKAGAAALEHDDELAAPLSGAERRQLVSLLAKLADQQG